MRVNKLVKRSSLRKEIERAFRDRFPSSKSSDLHWMILEKLIQDLPSLNPSLKSLLAKVASERSLDDYFNFQQLGEPQLYSSPDEYFSSTVVLSFLKKFPFGKVSNLDPLSKAESNSCKAETLCKITNRRLKYYRNRGFRLKNRWRGFDSIFHTARLLISSWLGPLDLNKIYDYTRHGPGGAVGVTGDATTAYYKYAAEHYSVSTRALPYAEAAILADPLWRRYVKNPDSILGDPVPTPEECRDDVLKRFKVVDYNKVTFVPKTAQTHRAIAIEPLMNIFLQLGVGDFLSDILRKAGLDLRSQVRNQNLARIGSIGDCEPEERPVTIDLSMASDTLSIELVKDLLPEEWFNLLDDLRSQYGSANGLVSRWAKFSSMGNGFTFQLESLIFYALTLSVARHLGYGRSNISVYGDDIICPAGMSLQLIDVLAFSGFKINANKSYLTGSFRESCGTDWFEGRNVRPFFLRRKIQNARDLLFILNSFGGLYDRLADRRPFANSTFDFTRKFLLTITPKVVKDNLLGPRSEDKEGHIHAPWDISQKSRFVLWNREFQSWSYASVKASPLKYRGEVGPIVLQMMGRNGSRSFRTSTETKLFRSVDSLLTLEVVDSVASIGKSNEVTRRSSTKLRLATQTTHGWRND